MSQSRLEKLSCACHVENCILCEAKLFSGLSSDQVCAIKGIVSRKQYATRSILYHEGEPATQLFVIKEGMVKLSSTLPDGREQILCPRGSGQLMGFGTTKQATYRHTAEALTEVSVCTIPHKEMKQVIQQNPETALEVVELLNRELGISQTMIRNLGLKTASEKVASFILSLIPVDSGAQPEISLPLSRLEIAEMLGLTIETVSRLMADFRRKSIIVTPRGSVQVLDLEELTKLAGEELAKGDYLQTLHA